MNVSTISWPLFFRLRMLQTTWVKRRCQSNHFVPERFENIHEACDCCLTVKYSFSNSDSEFNESWGTNVVEAFWLIVPYHKKRRKIRSFFSTMLSKTPVIRFWQRAKRTQKFRKKNVHRKRRSETTTLLMRLVDMPILTILNFLTSVADCGLKRSAGDLFLSGISKRQFKFFFRSLDTNIQNE